jgi:hypothetical protein
LEFKNLFKFWNWEVAVVDFVKVYWQVSVVDFVKVYWQVSVVDFVKFYWQVSVVDFVKVYWQVSVVDFVNVYWQVSVVDFVKVYWQESYGDYILSEVYGVKVKFCFVGLVYLLLTLFTRCSYQQDKWAKPVNLPKNSAPSAMGVERWLEESCHLVIKG